MNNVNVLFVISCIFVPLLLISINYDSISDFYAYDVSLNSLIIPNQLPSIAKDFQEIYNYKDSECFTTPNENLFCYSKPLMHGDSRASHVMGENGFEGEIHFDPVDVGVDYFTIKNTTRISEDTTMITFADKDYRVGNKNRVDYEITDKFEFDTIIEKYDTFIAKCNNYEGTSVTIVQYLGIDTIDSVDYFITWHTPANSEQGVTCDYPQIIQHSLKHNFKEL
jgi:hypothetical protein